jgi:beta-carotene hydroxylase
MKEQPSPAIAKPTLKELGADLLILSTPQLYLTIILPFLVCAFYFVFASNGLWIPAVLCTMALSFLSYGSTSHDFVHENLKINKTVNTVLLSMLELLCFRSGHAYKLSHLYHHKRFPHDDDVEGSAARMTLFRSLLEGVVFQPKIYYWAVTKHKNFRYYSLMIFEGISVVILIGLCCASLAYTPMFFAYMCLMIAGSWIIPFMTAYAVHTPKGENELHQTRLFRGKFFSFIAFDHLFHLEHHLYPMVPHKNWPKLADRLDAYFKASGVEPLEIKI